MACEHDFKPSHVTYINHEDEGNVRFSRYRQQPGKLCRRCGLFTLGNYRDLVFDIGETYSEIDTGEKHGDV